MDVCIVDYGAGNLTSVIKGFRAVGGSPSVTADAARVSVSRAIVVPGVGHFAQTAGIGADVRVAIQEALDSGAALLGICLGMQWLFEGSEEAGDIRGLGAIPGSCQPIPSRPGLKIPHAGWNRIELAGGPSRLLEGVAPGAYAYFTHSYAAPETDAATAVTQHGIAFPCVVERGRISGVQFHPEKSGDAGLRILRNFIRLAEAG